MKPFPERTPNMPRKPPTAKPHLTKMYAEGYFTWFCQQRNVPGHAYGHTPQEAAFRLHPGAAR